ncbi:hypothetical protein LS71_001015 [Helicobacter jaachi]|uniref:Uncharacterized protein n=1 Tax=Helicobacter jaachi TaxID=1677920 RepID=A0A4U8TF75_9HELI|nr:hypothetical protein [Helicobacter jaachi]TLD97367.1 hypothetical protein LS71_001015 [Helicobacter jaachi]
MTITIKSDNKELIKALKTMAKLANATIITKKSPPKSPLQKALNELKKIEANPHLYKSYKTAKDMIKDCLK